MAVKNSGEILGKFWRIENSVENSVENSTILFWHLTNLFNYLK